MLVKEISREIFTYFSFDEVIDKIEGFIHDDFLKSLTPNGIPSHELVLKRNRPIMLLRNINLSEGLCNGTRFIYREFKRNVILIETGICEYRGKQVFLPKIPFIPLEGSKHLVLFKKTQFSIRPYFAMTINKVQGQTLDFVGLYLPEPVFSHGQLYVALSRARTRENIKVIINLKEDIFSANSSFVKKNNIELYKV
ncbi:ATP-dependent DNA helicase PIF1-like [Olea europaea var. sylvestris]|uniref:ATP-dependent DNA helicase PIF1-like n=1 Tax=Olea europaea var. sylvestris TaxID=158386 RepID=UPI000C1D8916|nr:ATP-dependent DNA helicase PIF1-like [Olea europaea var. sylvestris]